MLCRDHLCLFGTSTVELFSNFWNGKTEDGDAGTFRWECRRLVQYGEVLAGLAGRLEFEPRRESCSFLASRVPIKESRLDVEWKKDSEHQTEQRVLLWTLEKQEPFLTRMNQVVSSTKTNTEMHLPLFCDFEQQRWWMVSVSWTKTCLPLTQHQLWKGREIFHVSSDNTKLISLSPVRLRHSNK